MGTDGNFCHLALWDGTMRSFWLAQERSEEDVHKPLITSTFISTPSPYKTSSVLYHKAVRLFRNMTSLYLQNAGVSNKHLVIFILHRSLWEIREGSVQGLFSRVKSYV